MKKRTKRIILVIAIVILTLIILTFALSAVVYDMNFGMRYEQSPSSIRLADDFDGLEMTNVTFHSTDETELAGYVYKSKTQEEKGVIVMAHGLGGGHNSYIDVANEFASSGYSVFGYDVTGNYGSGGESIRGLPQGIIDLECAIEYVKADDQFQGLPIFLFGHSWGAYSAGTVLNIQPEIAGVVMLAGMNKSADIIEYQGESIVGGFIKVMLPFVTLVENIKFGKYANYTCLDGFKNSDAGVMIIHSKDDNVVPYTHYETFYENFSDDDRFEFVSYENKGHSFLYYSDEMRQYESDLKKEYFNYLNESGVEGSYELFLNAEVYTGEKIDTQLYYQLDEELMKNIIAFYDSNLL